MKDVDSITDAFLTRANTNRGEGDVLGPPLGNDDGTRDDAYLTELRHFIKNRTRILRVYYSSIVFFVVGVPLLLSRISHKGLEFPVGSALLSPLLVFLWKVVALNEERKAAIENELLMELRMSRSEKHAYLSTNLHIRRKQRLRSTSRNAEK